MSLYRQKQGLFGTQSAHEDRTKIGAPLWWEDYGSQTPELQAIAIRILSQTVSSSSLESLWSSFSHIHSKKRNRLGQQKTNDLVFVASNLRLLARSSEPSADPFIPWREDSDERESGEGEGDVFLGEEDSSATE